MTHPTSPLDSHSHHNAVELGDPAYGSNPAAVFRALRQAHGPVAPVLLHGGVPAWLVMGHRELQHVTNDTTTFARNRRHWRLMEHLPADWPLWPMVGGGQAADSLLYAEGDTHRRRSAAMHQALKEIDLIEFRARTEEFAAALLSRFAPRGEADLMQYAQMLPVAALGWALGVPTSKSQTLVEGMNAMLSGGPDAPAGQQTARDIISALVHNPPPGTVTERLAAHHAGLTTAQQIEDGMVAIIAGHQTTAYWIGNALRLMLTAERFIDSFGRGRLSVSDALREVLWEDTPTQIFAGRWTTRPAELGHYLIPAGDLVLLGLAAANADPHIRPDPSAGTGGSRAYLSYSHGPHGCPSPAQRCADVIATTGIEYLMDQLPDMQLACQADELRWQPGVWMRGLQTLPVRFTPAPPVTAHHGGVPWT